MFLLHCRLFSSKALKDYGVTNTQDIQLVTPGLVINNTTVTSKIYMRGIGSRLAFAGLDPSIATYVDDRYIGRAQASTFEFVDVERIEVLKGLQGTLYGRNSTGGAIRVVTKDVYDEFSGDMTATAGNYGLYSFSGTVNVPVADKFSMCLSALTKNRDGFADNLDPRGRSEWDDIDYNAYKAKFRWDASDSITAKLSLEYSEKDDTEGNDVVDLSPAGANRAIAIGNLQGREVLTGRDVDEVATAITQANGIEEFAETLRVDFALDGMDFASITTYWDYDGLTSTDADGTSGRDTDVPIVFQTTESYSQEFQLL